MAPQKENLFHQPITRRKIRCLRDKYSDLVTRSLRILRFTLFYLWNSIHHSLYAILP